MPTPSESKLPGLPGFDPNNLQRWTVEVVASMTVLAVVAVGLRLMSRQLNGQKLWWDDYMIMFSMGWNFAVVGFVFAMYSSGMGIHADLVDPADIVMMAKWLVVAEILYAWNLGWTKLSLLLMYYRIFRVDYFKRMAWAVGAFVWAWVICITFLFVFICVPVEKLWYPQLPGRCINQVGTWIANAASTLLTDFIILLMPLPQIWKLHLKNSEKIGLTAAFSLGFFVIFASAYRTSVLFTYTSTDPTYTLAPTVGWTVIEMSAGIISACLPTMLPVLNAVLRRLGLKLPASARAASSEYYTDERSNISRQDDGGNIPDTSGKRASNSFYRLPDGNDSGGARAPPTPLEAKLRPDGREYSYTVECQTMGGRDDSSDDIPLQGIQVDTEFKRLTSKK